MGSLKRNLNYNMESIRCMGHGGHALQARLSTMGKEWEVSRGKRRSMVVVQGRESSRQQKREGAAVQPRGSHMGTTHSHLHILSLLSLMMAPSKSDAFL